MKVSVITSQKVLFNNPDIEVVSTLEEASFDFVLFLNKTDKIFSDFSVLRNLTVSPDIAFVQFSFLKEDTKGVYAKKESVLSEGFFTLSKATPLWDNMYNKIFRKSLIKNAFQNNKVDMTELLLKRFYNLNRVLLIREVIDKIDFVFPYVTDKDVEWRKIRDSYLHESSDAKYSNFSEKDYGTGIQRFRDVDMLKYMFRAIDNNLPFINNVYMLVMSESQVPAWVNRSKIKVVLHKDFIPQEYLPTFCSNTIEMFLWNIPGLSEKFIYANDDMYVTTPQTVDKWFRNDFPVFFCNERERNWEWAGDETRNIQYKLITGSRRNDIVIDQQHGIFPMRKSLLIECFEKYKEQILNSVTRFRDPKNYNQWLWSEFAFYTNRSINEKHKMTSRVLNNKNRDKIYKWDLSKFDFVCLNDGGSEQTDEDMRVVHEKFDAHFPFKSRFEV